MGKGRISGGRSSREVKISRGSGSRGGKSSGREHGCYRSLNSRKSEQVRETDSQIIFDKLS